MDDVPDSTSGTAPVTSTVVLSLPTAILKSSAWTCDTEKVKLWVLLAKPVALTVVL